MQTPSTLVKDHLHVHVHLYRKSSPLHTCFIPVLARQQLNAIDHHGLLSEEAKALLDRHSHERYER